MIRLIQILQKNRVFKFLASVRLAVPLMLVIAGVVAAGTLYESRYNAEVANLIIYRSWWFFGLMVLLWLNIFCAAVSRIPYKLHHLGFVVTHIGLLTLLIGAQITAQSGIDGQLRVLEGKSSSTVVLQDLVLEGRSEKGVAVKSDFKRSLDERGASSLQFQDFERNLGISIDHYFPFVESRQIPDPNGIGRGGIGVSFRMKSRFFDVQESLNLTDKPTLQMGPATLRLLKEHSTPHSVAKPKTSGRVVTILDAKSGKVLKTLSLSQLKSAPVEVAGVRVSLIRSLEEAVVAQNKLAENGTPGANPALELKVEMTGKALREVAYAKFKDFSLNRDGAHGLRFNYNAEGAESASSSPSGSPPSGSEDGLPSGNVIDFRMVSESTVEIRLSKNGSEVLRKTLKSGDTLQTPWMGMELTLEGVGATGSMIEKVSPIELPPKTNLPPSAILVRSNAPGSSAEWLVEGQSRAFQTSIGEVEIYYGPKTVQTPFLVNLVEFRKKDYPGTQTALSFESTIKIGESGSPQVIQMNEPLSEQGYLLYQSSYEMGPGIPTASIFSVNKDPGRITKYFGAVILCLGIVLFTLMRSKWYLNLRRSNS